MGQVIAETLRDSLTTALVVAHQEDTTALRRALAIEGFKVQVFQRSYSAEERAMPRAIRALLNHSSAWQEVIRADAPMLIVEADFVPCRGLGGLPMPYASEIANPKIAFLYAAGPVVYHHDRCGGFYGHGRHGFIPWHQADALMAPLHFMPAYARGDRLRYLAYRLRSRLRYAVKFIRGRYFDTWPNLLRLTPDRAAKLQFAWHRAFAQGC